MSAQSDESWDEIEVIPYFDVPNREVTREALDRVADSGIGPWEISILEAIWYDYGQVESEQQLTQRAFPSHSKKYPDKAAAAIKKCFAEDWIQILTVNFLDHMHQELVDEGYLMPNGLIGQEYLTEISPVGLISFTKSGASLYRRWVEFDPVGEWHFCVVGDTNGFGASYGTTLDACEYSIEDDHLKIIEREPPIRIGKWCNRWWNRFESGFKIRFRTAQDPLALS